MIKRKSEKAEPLVRKEKPSGIKRKRKKLGAHQAAKYILIVGIIIICIPVAVVGAILITASSGTGKPAEGHRFKGDLDPEITSDMVESIQSKIDSMADVENCEATLSTGQLTVYVDVDDSLTTTQIEEIAKDVYEKVDGVASVSRYFTNTSTKRMYDLAIDVFNYNDEDAVGFICWNVQKNAQMEEPRYNEITKALDEELAKELRGELVEEDDE